MNCIPSATGLVPLTRLTILLITLLWAVPISGFVTSPLPQVEEPASTPEEVYRFEDRAGSQDRPGGRRSQFGSRSFS